MAALSPLKKHSVVIAGHATSVTLEPVFWDILRAISKRDHRSLAQIIETVDASRDGNLSSALRVYAVVELMNDPGLSQNAVALARDTPASV